MLFESLLERRSDNRANTLKTHGKNDDDLKVKN